VTLILEGIRVLEVAEYGMVPSAASILGEWGADVIKVEHAFRGDASRGLVNSDLAPGTGGFTALWEPFNRSKRSIGLDLEVAEGRDIAMKLAERADVFLTNFLPAARRKLRLEVEDLRAVNPRIIYARGSAHGQKGPEAENGGFDALTFWMRCGVASGVLADESEDLPQQPGAGFGDVQTGMSLAGGIAGALFHRERTGEALEVDASLLGQGCWAMNGALVSANLSGWDETPKRYRDRKQTVNPLMNPYRTADGRWIILGMVQPDRYWAPLCKAIGHDELAQDPRFIDMNARRDNNSALIALLDDIFASRPLSEWEEVLSEQDGPWNVVQRVGDLNHDKQAWENGYLQVVDYGGGRSLTLGTAPVQFNCEASVLTRAPEHGENTEEVLLELGFEWDDIGRFRDAKAIA
jgi:crotonobetainyl-CoA:carnitine CoA-transferase CaiB-like acyl-CoA transferase